MGPSLRSAMLRVLLFGPLVQEPNTSVVHTCNVYMYHSDLVKFFRLFIIIIIIIIIIIVSLSLSLSDDVLR